MRGTATGAPRTMVGYYLGKFMCRIGRHKIIRWDACPDGICFREGCEA